MKLTPKTVTGARWADAAHTAIGCNVTFEEMGTEVVPFCAAPYDTMAYGRQLFADLVAGKYGPVAEYSPPA